MGISSGNILIYISTWTESLLTWFNQNNEGDWASKESWFHPLNKSWEKQGITYWNWLRISFLVSLCSFLCRSNRIWNRSPRFEVTDEIPSFRSSSHQNIANLWVHQASRESYKDFFLPPRLVANLNRGSSDKDHAYRADWPQIWTYPNLLLRSIIKLSNHDILHLGFTCC